MLYFYVILVHKYFGKFQYQKIQGISECYYPKAHTRYVTCRSHPGLEFRIKSRGRKKKAGKVDYLICKL